MFISKTTAAVLAMAGGMFVSTLAAQAQTTWYVDDDCTPPGAGTEADPFCLIQNGIDAAEDDAGAASTVTYTDVQGGWPGPGNINADPLFVDGPSGTWTADGVYAPNEGKTTLTDDAAGWVPGALAGMFINPDTDQTLQSLIVSNTATTITVWANFADLGTMRTDYQIRDYHAMDGSPVIDAADIAAVPSDTTDLDDDGDTDEPIPFDLDGNPRFVDDPETEDCPQAPGTCGDAPVVDMGCYEFQLCPADFDGDGTVGASDLAQLLGSWGPYEPCPPFDEADFNDDCAVNAADLAQLLGAWGECG